MAGIPSHLLGKFFLKFVVRRVAALLCSARRTPATTLKILPLLLSLMVAEPLLRDLMRSLAFGVIIAINHAIRVTPAGRFMVNQQTGRAHMMVGSIVLLLHMKPKSNSNLSGAPKASLAQTGSKSKALSCHFPSYSTPWIIDSGAFDHMTSFSNLFHNYNPCSGNEQIRIADGSYSIVVGKGLVNLSKTISLKSVFLVPKLACNLLSVSKLSRDSNCHVTFFESHCIFQEQSSGKMIGSARMIDGLYYFEDKDSKNKEAQGLSSISSIPVKDQIMLWHYRLGHPSFSYLKKLFSSLFRRLDTTILKIKAPRTKKLKA